MKKNHIILLAISAALLLVLPRTPSPQTRR